MRRPLGGPPPPGASAVGRSHPRYARPAGRTTKYLFRVRRCRLRREYDARDVPARVCRTGGRRAKTRESEVRVSNLMAMQAIRPALPRRPWHWPVPSCPAWPGSSSCSRHRQTYSVSARPPLSDRCWCRPTELSPAESRRVADSAVFPASSMTEPRHWSAALPAQRCKRWLTGCQAAELARCFRSW